VTIDNEGVICNLLDSCELCSGRGVTLYLDLKDNLFTAPGVWNICQCAACGLLWSNPQPRPDQIGKLYRTYYTHSVGASLSSKPFKSTGGGRIIKAILAKTFFWKPHVFKTDNFHLQGLRPGTLLDVGCGSGDFLAAAAKDGWKCYGIDFDTAAIAAANGRDGVSAEVGELIEKRYSAKSFDAIVLNNVIEHVWNPVETVAECHRILRPDGRLVMITPNADSYGHRIFKQYWRGLEPPRHLFIYNHRTILSLAKMAGFSHSSAFSSSGGSTGEAMLNASADLAKKAGRSVSLSAAAIPSLIKKETILGIFGRPRGEWIVLIGTKS
jgi:2-polyprenyl-3-methyl-5-hydroxy-6-metoxy-1,4-benzoquinol methylase